MNYLHVPTLQSFKQRSMNKSLLTNKEFHLHLVQGHELRSPSYRLYTAAPSMEHKELVDALAAQLSQIDPTVKFLDRSFPMGEESVDIIASLGVRDLLLASVQETLDVESLQKILFQREWALTNFSLFGHLFPRALVSSAPRITLWNFMTSMAPGVTTFLNAISFPLRLFAYQALEGPQDIILAVVPWQQNFSKHTAFTKEKRDPPPSPRKKMELTKEEIDDFLQQQEGEEDEITQKELLSKFL